MIARNVLAPIDWASRHGDHSALAVFVARQPE